MITEAQLVSEFDLHGAERKANSSQVRLDAMMQGMTARAQAYKSVFHVDSPAGFTVLQDLAWVGRANRSLFHTDPLEMARRAGMHEMWLRIQHHVALTPVQLVALYSDVFVKEGFGR